MKVRVFQRSDGVTVLIPTYPEALEEDTKRFFQNVPYFDCDNSELPLRKLPDGTCQRCSWICDMQNKKIVVKQPCDCIHNKFLALDKILNDPLAFRQDKLNALLDQELLKRSQFKVK